MFVVPRILWSILDGLFVSVGKKESKKERKEEETFIAVFKGRLSLGFRGQLTFIENCNPHCMPPVDHPRITGNRQRGCGKRGIGISSHFALHLANSARRHKTRKSSPKASQHLQRPFHTRPPHSSRPPTQPTSRVPLCSSQYTRTPQAPLLRLDLQPMPYIHFTC